MLIKQLMGGKVCGVVMAVVGGCVWWLVVGVVGHYSSTFRVF